MMTSSLLAILVFTTPALIAGSHHHSARPREEELVQPHQHDGHRSGLHWR